MKIRPYKYVGNWIKHGVELIFSDVEHSSLEKKTKEKESLLV